MQRVRSAAMETDSGEQREPEAPRYGPESALEASPTPSGAAEMALWLRAHFLVRAGKRVAWEPASAPEREPD